MHAASVHPEPGSNSQTNCISSVFRRSDSFELYILAIFTFLELWSLWFWQILFRTCFFALYFFYLLFNCQVSIRSLCESLSIISLLFRLVKRFFKTFLKNFFNFLQIHELISFLPLLRQLVYSTTLSPFCQVILKKIFFLVKFSKRIAMISIFYTLYPI